MKTIVETERGFEKIPMADVHMLPSFPHNMDPGTDEVVHKPVNVDYVYHTH